MLLEKVAMKVAMRIARTNPMRITMTVKTEVGWQRKDTLKAVRKADEREHLHESLRLETKMPKPMS